MSPCVLGFQDIEKTKITVVGGKGANLGEISKVEGIRVQLLALVPFACVSQSRPALDW
jgi:phosphoenolpyruvate synthase/pyruvate phosphate dikinase